MEIRVAEPSSIIMEGDWKLIHYHEDGRDELYHLGNDIGEQNDLIAKEKKLGQQMRKKLDAWLKQTNTSFPNPIQNLTQLKEKPAGRILKLQENKDLKNNTPLFWLLIISPIKTGGGSSVD